MLDEADKLFEQSLIKQTDAILAALSSQSIQKAMFSATITSHVEKLALSVMRDPVRVVVGKK